MTETTITSLSDDNARKKPSNVNSDADPKSVRDLVETTLVGKNAQDIVVIDLKGKSDIADYMIVASGNSRPHVGALADYVAEVLRKIGITPLQKEGKGGSEWVIIDNPLVVVHIFHPETRTIYNLEKMWDAEFSD